MDNDFQFLFKMVIIGDSGVGKSNLMTRYTADEFSMESQSTIGVEFMNKSLEIEGRDVKVQIWDTAGQERYRSVTRSYYKGAAGCLLVYDITNRDSYDAVEQWLQDAKNLAGQDVVVLLVGNKSDLGGSERRQVTHVEASTYAQQQGLMHFETSAATGDFIEEAFLKVARTVIMRQQDQEKERRERGEDEDENFTPLMNLDGTDGRSKSGKCGC
eukprot:TRINITY_DN611_c0_g3_i1.p2 TRINITY_DN611_c0_g3~~TRINITY_DN611_c0_g3_i1.p2  ORF type:complete len:214 (+),score=110.79 TRINITY_DN611_c0_g3_i1:355-996(+)